jgi:hypothetical protein
VVVQVGVECDGVFGEERCVHVVPDGDGSFAPLGVALDWRVVLCLS